MGVGGGVVCLQCQGVACFKGGFDVSPSFDDAVSAEGDEHGLRGRCWGGCFGGALRRGEVCSAFIGEGLGVGGDFFGKFFVEEVF